MLPKYLCIDEYAVDKSLTVPQIMNKINQDYPEYDILGPVTIKNPKGMFKICYFNLKLNHTKELASRYGI